jgi:hypothetical protein
MTTSTSSSASGFAVIIALMLTCSGCAAEPAAPVAPDKAGAPVRATAAQPKPATVATARAAALRNEIEARFDAAIKRGMVSPATFADAAFGMACTPAAISSGAPSLTIKLPADVAARRHPFAVLTPGGKLYEIYTPYGDDTESGDLLVPSDAISWELARNRADFAITAADLSAMELGKDQPMGVFVEAGIYQFALVNMIDKGLLSGPGGPGRVRAFAGCTVRWMP